MGVSVVVVVSTGVQGVSAAPAPLDPSRAGAARISSVAQGSKLEAAAAKAAADVTALKTELEKNEKADIAAREAASTADTELAAKRDAAAVSAEEQKALFAELGAEIVELRQKLVDLDGQLVVAEQTLKVRQKIFEAWSIATFIKSSDTDYVELTDPSNLKPLREQMLSTFGGDALRERRDDAKDDIAKIKAVQVTTKQRIADAEVEQRQADDARIEFELVATTAEEERVLALEEEFARQQAAEGARYELTIKISQAEAMATKFTLLDLTESTLIASQPVLDEYDLARWFASTGRTARLTVSMEELTYNFISEGRAENIRMDIAFAQSILETASFGFPSYGQLKPEDNNYAGIGACDACANGFGFPDSLSGVRAQAQLLKIYANPGLTAADFANPSVRWDPEKLGIRGCCPTFRQLAGVWATTPTYFQLIDSVWVGIVNWVADDYLKNGPRGTSGSAAIAPGGIDTSGASGASGTVGVDPLGELDGGGD